MNIYIASESGMPNAQLFSREDFIIKEGSSGRLLSYYHITDSKFSSGKCFRYLIEERNNESIGTQESTGTGKARPGE